MKKFFKIMLWVLVGALFIGTFVFLYKNSQPDKVTYAIVSPQTGNIERTTVLTGKIEPRDEINIKPQISGIITEINVDPGDIVKEGDIIAKIKVIPEASQLSSAQSRVESARISLADAKNKYERNKSLFDKKIISREEYETSETTYQQALRELDAANDAFTIVREGEQIQRHREQHSCQSHYRRSHPRRAGKSRLFGNTGEHLQRRHHRSNYSRHEQPHIQRQC